MFIDLIIIVLFVIAVFKGYKRGLIIGVFSFVAIIIGLAAAIKLSTVVAAYLGNTVNISERWLPAISFALVFLLVVVLVRLGANLLEKTVQFMMLGWINKLGGIVFYTVIYMIVCSVLLFYAEQLKLLKPDVIAQSAFYGYIKPWGPKAMNSLGTLIPFFKDMFSELSKFFDTVSKEITGYSFFQLFLS
jgi:membrane protein required for colicin V production